MLPLERVRSTFAHVFLTASGAEPTQQRIAAVLTFAEDFEALELDNAVLLKFAVGCVLDGERVP